MDVNEGTVNAAMNCIAAMAIEEIAVLRTVKIEDAATSFLASKTAERLFDDKNKLWWDGPSSIVEDFMNEQLTISGDRQQTRKDPPGTSSIEPCRAAWEI